MLQKAIDKVNELIAVDMGSLVEEKGRREKVQLLFNDGRYTRLPPHSVNGPKRKSSLAWSPFAISTCAPKSSALL
jgi:hypothetical protein